MPTKITNKDKEFLLKVSLPERTMTYTPIAHSFAIDKIMNALQNKGMIIEKESYRASANGNIANGVFEIKHTDEEHGLKMICCFSNSYDKSTRFSVAIGAQVMSSGNYFLSDISWIRKHSGRADVEANNIIKEHAEKAEEYFKKLLDLKTVMEKQVCTKERFGSMIGQLYVNELLSTDQISECNKQWKAMEISTKNDKIYLWTAFQYILQALQSTHPGKWIINQALTTMYVSNMFKIKQYMHNEQTELDFTESDEIANPSVEVNNSITENVEEEDEETIEEVEDNVCHVTVLNTEEHPNNGTLEGTEYDDTDKVHVTVLNTEEHPNGGTLEGTEYEDTDTPHITVLAEPVLGEYEDDKTEDESIDTSAEIDELFHEIEEVVKENVEPTVEDDVTIIEDTATTDQPQQEPDEEVIETIDDTVIVEEGEDNQVRDNIILNEIKVTLQEIIDNFDGVFVAFDEGDTYRVVTNDDVYHICK